MDFIFKRQWTLCAVCRSVLESADQALRQKPRQPSGIVSSVVKSPPLKSSIQKIAVESTQLVAAAADVRTVVHSKSKDSARHEKRHRRHHSSSSRTQTSDHATAPPSRAAQQLLITVTEVEIHVFIQLNNNYRLNV